VLRNLCCLAIGLTLVVAASSSGFSTERPNVVILLADDLGFTDLGCCGQQLASTPNLDRLASEGARFTDFYAGQAVCSPSRACLLTGRVPARVGVWSWISPRHRMHLKKSETTLAELLHEAGYATAHVGKWHLSPQVVDRDGYSPAEHGFDHYIATQNNANPSHKQPNNFVRNGEAVGETESYSCQIVVDEAIDWLESKREPDKPFFLNVWFHEPHLKVAAPPELADNYTDLTDSEKWQHYYGCIENMDHAAGRLLAKIEEMGAADNTLVVFTSDNGSYNGPSCEPFRGRKTQLWEGGIRVPGIAKWPGKIEAGKVIEEPAGIVDLLPTVCDAVGIDAPDVTLDGTSLWPALTDGSISRTKPLFWFYQPARPVCVIRDGGWSLVADPTIDLDRDNYFHEEMIGNIKKSGLTNFRLFNLEQDPHQDNDVSAEHPERTESMKRQMTALHAEIIAEGEDWREWEQK